MNGGYRMAAEMPEEPKPKAPPWWVGPKEAIGDWIYDHREVLTFSAGIIVIIGAIALLCWGIQLHDDAQKAQMNRFMAEAPCESFGSWAEHDVPARCLKFWRDR